MPAKPVVIITQKKTMYYPSIKDASNALGISKQRLIRGLASPYGEVPRTRPQIYIDEAVGCNSVR